MNRQRSLFVKKVAHVSYANCGLPYYVGGVIAEEKDLLLQTPASLHARSGLDVRVSTEVLAVNPSIKGCRDQKLNHLGKPMNLIMTN